MRRLAELRGRPGAVARASRSAASPGRCWRRPGSAWWRPRAVALESRAELQLDRGRHRELIGELVELVAEFPVPGAAAAPVHAGAVPQRAAGRGVGGLPRVRRPAPGGIRHRAGRGASRAAPTNPPRRPGPHSPRRPASTGPSARTKPSGYRRPSGGTAGAGAPRPCRLHRLRSAAPPCRADRAAQRRPRAARRRPPACDRAAPPASGGRLRRRSRRASAELTRPRRCAGPPPRVPACPSAGSRSPTSRHAGHRRRPGPRSPAPRWISNTATAVGTALLLLSFGCVTWVVILGVRESGGAVGGSRLAGVGYLAADLLVS